MKKTLLIAGALLCLGVSLASAGGINLSWNDCGTTGQGAQTFACNTNTGAPHIMVGSAVSPVDIPAMVAMAAVLDLQTNQAALSPWWNFDPSNPPASTGCRSGPPSALSASFDFTTGPFACNDIWGGVASGGSNYQSQFGSANRGRIRLVCAVAAPVGVDNVTENYYFKVTFNNSKSTGTGNCAGCQDGACIVFNSIELDQNPGLGNTEISNPLNSQFVTWQSGGGNVTGGCPAATPTRNSTWGSVKSLYR
jgi:hypothetical protein